MGLRLRGHRGADSAPLRHDSEAPQDHQERAQRRDPREVEDLLSPPELVRQGPQEQRQGQTLQQVAEPDRAPAPASATGAGHREDSAAGDCVFKTARACSQAEVLEWCGSPPTHGGPFSVWASSSSVPPRNASDPQASPPPPPTRGPPGLGTNPRRRAPKAPPYVPPRPKACQRQPRSEPNPAAPMLLDLRPDQPSPGPSMSPEWLLRKGTSPGCCGASHR